MKINNISFLTVLRQGALIGLLFFAVYAVHGQKVKRPNILIILVDDLKPNLGAYGDPHAISPNIDALSNSGMRFDQAYSNQAVCVSSRYNLILGSRSTSTGLYDFGKEFRDVIPDAVTMPQYFRAAG
jgi:iduronate 2-sulfatase